MQPRWFYAIVAACAVVLTLTASYVMVSRRNVGRWVPVPGITDVNDARALDTTTGTLCVLPSQAAGAGCIDVPRATIRHLERRDADRP